MDTDTDESKLKVGAIGLGELASRYIEDVIELGHHVIGADANPSLRDSFEASFGNEAYDDFTDILDADVDAIIVTVPTRFHEKIAIAALQQGVDVFLEKPLAHNVESAERIVAAARDTDAMCMVGNYFQFAHHTEILKSYVEDGYLGELSHIHVSHAWRRRVPLKGSWFTTKAVAGGGVLMDRGPFVLQLLLEFTGYPDVDRLMAKTWSDFGDRDDYSYLHMYGEEGDERVYDVEDAAIALIEFENGCSASLDLAWASNVQENSKHYYRLRGTEAGALLDLSSMQGSLTLNEARSRGRDHFLNTEVEANNIDIHRAQTEYFLSNVQSREGPGLNTVENALATNRLIAQIYESADHD